MMQKIGYADLYCTDEDRKKIGWIITTVENGGIDLIWERKRLDDVGDEIMPVHPYKFLSTIILDPKLKNSLKNIFQYIFPFKKMGFLAGVKKGMEREWGNLETHMGEFASEMGTTCEKIRPLILAKDWNGLVCHLLSIDSGHKN